MCSGFTMAQIAGDYCVTRSLAPQTATAFSVIGLNITYVSDKCLTTFTKEAA